MTGLRRWRTLCGISLALVITAGAVAASAATAGAAAAASGPACTFDGEQFSDRHGRYRR